MREAMPWVLAQCSHCGGSLYRDEDGYICINCGRGLAPQAAPRQDIPATVAAGGTIIRVHSEILANFVLEAGTAALRELWDSFGPRRGRGRPRKYPLAG